MEVAQIMPVYVGVGKEKEVTPWIHSSQAMDTATLEKLMFELVNEERAGHKIKPLEFSSALGRVARVQSENMARSKEVVHNLPGCPDLSERLRDSGLMVSRQGENVACDTSIEAANENLMKSPGHRQTILDTGFSHVGIGIVKHGKVLYITQNFAVFIPKISPSEGRRTLFLKINQLWRSSLQENPTLSAIAQAHSEKMAGAGKIMSADVLTGMVDSRGVKYRQMSLQVMSSPTLEVIASEVGKKTDLSAMKEIGIGLRQSAEG